MAKSLTVSKFIAQPNPQPIIDVRTPDEYAKGHLPGAINLPLFSNDERAEVGRIYKQKGQQAAILLGLDFVGPKMRLLLEQLDTVTSDKRVSIYCWRGGMRSQSVAWLAELYGYQAVTLRGGYKAFRRHILAAFDQTKTLLILGGRTGSGKTDILTILAKQGHPVIDLEKLAKHKGSVFGNLSGHAQPTQQQFENRLGLIWQNQASDTPIWVEDESRKIGEITIPEAIWQQMRQATTIFLDVPFDLRVARLVAEYGQQDADYLSQAILKLKKRLGGLHTREALEALACRDLSSCCAILLEHYYDKAYLHSLSRKTKSEICHLVLETIDPVENAAKLIAHVQQ